MALPRLSSSSSRRILESTVAYTGDLTWVMGRGVSVTLTAMPLDQLSELERDLLRDVVKTRMQEISPITATSLTAADKWRKSIRRKLGKDKTKDKDFTPQAFGIPLADVIANDVRRRRGPDILEEEGHRTLGNQQGDALGSVGDVCGLRGVTGLRSEPAGGETPPHSQRRGAVSAYSLTELGPAGAHVLEALHSGGAAPKVGQPPWGWRRRGGETLLLGLNPLCRQVPQLVDECCSYIERHGLCTEGIFRVGGSRKRVKQLREAYDSGLPAPLAASPSVHDVAALLKEFLRSLPDPLLTRALTPAFLTSQGLDSALRRHILGLLICLLPPCHAGTLLRLLSTLTHVAHHAETIGKEIHGNRMTELNLATVLGPTLVWSGRGSQQGPAIALNSTSTINLVRSLIQSQHLLFQVSPELQHGVLLRLMETDADVVEFLLRRRLRSQTDGDLDTEWEDTVHAPRFLSENGAVCPSGDSIPREEGERTSEQDSDGENSPYDNNSPILGEHRRNATSSRLCHAQSQPGSASHITGVVSPQRHKHMAAWLFSASEKHLVERGPESSPASESSNTDNEDTMLETFV